MIELTSVPAGMSSMAARPMMVPRIGWTGNRMNSELGSNAWLALWLRVALYLLYYCILLDFGNLVSTHKITLHNLCFKDLIVHNKNMWLSFGGFPKSA